MILGQLRDDPDFAKEVRKAKEAKDKGIAEFERSLKGLGVANGERSLVVMKQLDETKDKAEREALWNQYVDQKIITKQVADQLRAREIREVLYSTKSKTSRAKAWQKMVEDGVITADIAREYKRLFSKKKN